MEKGIAVAVAVALVAGAVWLVVGGRAFQSEPPPARVLKGPEAPKAGEAPSPFAAGPLLAERVGYQLAVYHLPKPKVDPVATLERLVAERGGRFAIAEGADFPEKVPAIRVQVKAASEYAPPDPSHLDYFGRGLSDEERAALAGCEEVTVLDVGTAGTDAASTLHEVEQLVAALAEATGGLPWDEETRLVFSQQAWAKLIEEGWKDGAPHVPSHTVIHAYRHGSLPRLITLGMAKFGLPDLVVNECAASSGQAMGTLINLASQTMFEHPVITEAGRLAVDVDGIRGERMRTALTESLLEGAQRKSNLSIAKGKPEEGDPDNLLVEILFPRAPGVGLAEAQKALLGGLLGSKDALVHVEHDGELERASARARKRLIEVIKPDFRSILDDTGHLSVKAAFKTDSGGNEYMWIEVVEWEGTELTGLLDNQPFEIAGLKAGARVSVSEESVFDYLLQRRGEEKEGNETSVIIERLAAERP